MSGVVYEFLHKQCGYAVLSVFFFGHYVFNPEQLVYAVLVVDGLACCVADDFAFFFCDEAASCVEVEVEVRRSDFPLVLYFFVVLLWIALFEVLEILVVSFVKELFVCFMVCFPHFSYAQLNLPSRC